MSSAMTTSSLLFFWYLLTLLLVTPKIHHHSGSVVTYASAAAVEVEAAAVINPNIADVCDSPSLDAVGVSAEQTCIKHKNNITRCYYAYIPESVRNNTSSSAVPLVLDLHGYNLCAIYQANITGWANVAEEYGFVVVWPQGNMNANFTNHPCWDYGNCCCSLGPPPSPEDLPAGTSFLDLPERGPDMDDETFLRQVVANVVYSLARNANVTIDTKRLYFGGHSNGCMMSNAMAALSSDLVAAVCCHASSLPLDVDDVPLDEYIPTSVQMIYGDLDISLEGIFGSKTDFTDKWYVINDCQFNQSNLVNDENDSLLYTTQTYTGCMNDTVVETIELVDVGHFPFQGFNPNNTLSTGVYPGAITPTVDTARLAWAFCSQFSSSVAPVLPSPVETVPADVFASLSNDKGDEELNDTATAANDETSSAFIYLFAKTNEVTGTLTVVITIVVTVLDRYLLF